MSWEAAASVAGPIISGVMGQGAQGSANRTNMKIAQRQEQFQERMSSTAHQREVEDLRAAGLNPLLSATGGHGASTPSGASTQVQANNEMGKGLERSVSNAVDARRLRKELDATDSQVSLNKSAMATQATQQQLNTSNAIVAKTNAESTALKNSILKTQAPTIAKRTQADLKHAEIDAAYANQDAILNRTGKITSAVGNLLGVGKFLKMFGSPDGKGKKPSGYTQENYSQQGEHMGTHQRTYNYRD